MDNKELEDHINYLERQYSKILNNLNEEIRQEEEGLQAAAILEPQDQDEGNNKFLFIEVLSYRQFTWET